MSNDAELLRRYAAEGAEDAFTELVRRHVDFVYAAALRQTRNPHRAEDVAQTVFTDLARKAGRLARRDELVGWLYTSTRYAAIKVVRAEARRARREQEAQMSEELIRDTDSQVDWEKLRPVLDEALGALNERERAAILLRFFKGGTFAEVGVALRLTEDAARKRVERALEKLHGLLARRGVTSTAAALGVVLANQATAAAAPAGLAASVASTALAGAATAGGVTVVLTGLGEFMATSKTAAGIAAIVGVLSIGTVVYETQQARTAETARRVAAQACDTRQEQLRKLQLRVEAAESESYKLHQKAASARAPEAGAVAPASARSRSTSAPAASAAARAEADAATELGKKFLALHPEARELILMRQQGFFAQEYGALYRALGLTPEQVGRFEALMLEQSSLMITGPGGQPVAFSFVPESGAVGEQAFVEALGEAGYRQFKEYDRTRGARSLVTELAGELYFSENPLTPAQTERMAQILTHNCPDYQNGGAFRSYSPLDWEGAVAEAREVLTGTQLASLSELRVRKEQVRATIEARRQGPAQTANAARTN